MESGFGLGTVAQLVPFQRMISVRLNGLVESPAVPTAQALVAVRDFTPLSVPVVAPDGSGLGTRLQELPFHRSISVPVPTWPTAHTLLVASPSTPNR